MRKFFTRAGSSQMASSQRLFDANWIDHFGASNAA
jgi:hypothetical protein